MTLRWNAVQRNDGPGVQPTVVWWCRGSAVIAIGSPAPHQLALYSCVTIDTRSNVTFATWPCAHPGKQRSVLEALRALLVFQDQKQPARTLGSAHLISELEGYAPVRGQDLHCAPAGMSLLDCCTLEQPRRCSATLQ
jgi:hypothetical protein